MGKKRVILIVEDDPKLLEVLCDFFISDNFEVLFTSDGQEALDIYFSNNHRIDIVILDVMLPHVDGYEILRTIREYSDVPIIMATAKESEEDQLQGLNNGADNYITKPFRLRVLRAHVDVLLKRKSVEKEEELFAGGLRLENLSQKAFLDGELLNLTPKEYHLLLYFVKNKHRVLTREAILDGVWGFDYDGDIRTVDTLVKQLRKKMKDKSFYIQSIYGIGYRFEEDLNE
ncbi:MAG: response regulator transcription factor [Lachnospiraceae bacterium]|nr:response regulator transcription factor [Lachnospiraceae bacterium]